MHDGHLLNFLRFVRETLASIHPLAPWVFLSLAIWAGVTVWRKHWPQSWEWFSNWPSPTSAAAHMIQALPSAIIGAAFAAWSTGGGIDMAAMGAISGLGAPLIHHILKAAPGSYKGALGKVDDQ